MKRWQIGVGCHYVQDSEKALSRKCSNGIKCALTSSESTIQLTPDNAELNMGPVFFGFFFFPGVIGEGSERQGGSLASGQGQLTTIF